MYIVIISLMFITSLYIIYSTNPFHSLLFIIIFVVLVTISLILSKLAFLGLLLGLVYLGAILILFFFILLILNLQLVVRDNFHLKRFPLIGFIISAFLLIWVFTLKSEGLGLLSLSLLPKANNFLLVESLSNAIFNNHFPFIIALVLILLLGLVAIVFILISTKNLNLKSRI